MKKWFLHILLLAGLFGTLTTSCSQEEGLEPQASDEKVQVMFTIALNGPSSARSRGTWKDNMDDNTENNYPEHIGDNFDNSIDPDQLFVKLTLTDVNGVSNTYDVQNIAYWQEGDINEYKFVGEVPVTLSTTTKYATAKIVVYANVSNINGNIAESFSTNYNSNPGTGVEYIPMWGVKTISNLSLTPGSMRDLGENNPIYLLRAMAKVEVTLNQTTWNQGYRITSATLNKYNAEGYVVPTFKVSKTENGTTSTVTTTLENLGETTDLLLDEVINEKTGTSTPTDLAIPATNTNRTYVIYLPEMTKNTSEPIKINLTLGKTATDADGNETITDITTSVMGGNPHIVLKDYAQGGSHFDITRNHWYQYTINQINDGFNITVNVKPWTLQDINLDFSDIVTYNVTGWTEGTYGSIDEKNHLVYMTKEGETPKPAEFIFNIETPENCECEIGLTNNVDFSVKKESTIDGGIKVTITALDTTAEYPKTSLYAFAKDKGGRNIELDLTTDAQNPSTANQTSVNRFTIIQNW